MPVQRALCVGLSSSLSRCSAPMLVCLISSSGPTMSTVGPAEAGGGAVVAIRARSPLRMPAAKAAEREPTNSISSPAKGPVSGSRKKAAPPQTWLPLSRKTTRISSL